MICPHCHHDSSKVVDSRPSDEGRAIRRRRECEFCGTRFTTFERIEKSPLLVIKKNGNREEFRREKLLRGLVRAAEKRPVTMDQMNAIVDRVENKIRATGENEVKSQEIGEYVMKELADVDDVTYIRFASVYREFKDMSGFMNEVQEMMANDKSDKKDSKK
ncbi:transcriptional regulator NrdR [Companilactobacillus sp.]|jgi:transcriptional repressor NrdR|uniref:transcriptional regulator NrdR n=1 Tax=Companilactobacillus sp. TaxID=2767905 RepID=UPI0025C37385|nr:transcriptional regulator NrdR [Companilactobacillus sp.]MCH4007977.1 transcriptional regulator NrdR [Companilactobacillus sp.]MCH4051844.1 transcriptional regulator NrdR [Companilactobacillus sp.]MCH4075920.1 transcriptional regulator NrdR [Companilactobacillus sp.]MCH4124495.1 transcriptional regulator NrdR [Companilactobacillus sp.]MCH4132542.1 transcriptional regulator NrdR [Companilactobacillus sp.]